MVLEFFDEGLEEVTAHGGDGGGEGDIGEAGAWEGEVAVEGVDEDFVAILAGFVFAFKGEVGGFFG